MNTRYICYCGLYCESCAVKSKVEPSAERLLAEMRNAGFEHIIDMIPGGTEFWPFLKSMAEDGACLSCKEGSGNPGCEVRICAQQKDVDMCAYCDSYPCSLFEPFFENYPVLKEDNALLLREGMGAWAHLQDERVIQGFAYSDVNRKQQEAH